MAITTAKAPARQSPLTQGRGLKRDPARVGGYPLRSPLTQGRGLKQPESGLTSVLSFVAPHTGAWIETSNGNRNLFRIACRPSHRGVD